MMKTKIAQKMALAQTNGFFSAFRIPTNSPLLQTASHIISCNPDHNSIDRFDWLFLVISGSVIHNIMNDGTGNYQNKQSKRSKPKGHRP